MKIDYYQRQLQYWLGGDLAPTIGTVATVILDDDGVDLGYREKMNSFDFWDL